MKMSKCVEKALRASIKHWEVDVLKNGEYPHTGNCPMCRAIFKHEHGDWKFDMCDKCLFGISNTKICGKSYRDYIIIYNKSVNTLEMKKRARRIIRKMKSLLPKKGEL